MVGLTLEAEGWQGAVGKAAACHQRTLQGGTQDRSGSDGFFPVAKNLPEPVTAARRDSPGAR